jgi:DHA1 family multidrug resistance protein-like MFS transporter
MNALVGKLTTRETYGKAYGLMASMSSLGMTLGPLAGGIMASHMGFRWPFVVVSLLLSLVVIPVTDNLQHAPAIPAAVRHRLMCFIRVLQSVTFCLFSIVF